MDSRPRHRRTALVLAALTAVVVATGLAERAWALVAGLVAPWQREQSARALAPAEETAVQMRERLARLNAENVVLRRRLEEYAAIVGEGRVPPAQVVVARGRIIARDLRQGRRFCELDVGAVDGVEIGLPVALGWSLVGTVAGRTAGRCLVREIGDADSRVPAALYSGEELLAEGILRGLGVADRARLDFIEDRPGIHVEPGQTVVTAGIDGMLPGLVLGTVASADRVGAAADHWRIDITPLRTAADAESLLVLRMVEPVAAPAR